VRFHESATRPMGRATAGVRGMSFRGDDEVIEIAIATDDADLLVVTENGFGKRTRISEYRRTGRGGLGVRTVAITEAKGRLVGARVVRDGYQVMLISDGGTVIRMPVEGIRRAGRATQGVIVMRLRGDERVSSLAPVVEAADTTEEAVETDGTPTPALGNDFAEADGSFLGSEGVDEESGTELDPGEDG